VSLYLQYIASTLQVEAETTQNPPINRKATRNQAKTTGYISGNSLEIHGKFIHLHQKKNRHRLVSLSSLAAPEFSQGHRLKLLEEWNCEALNDSLNGKWT